MPRYRENPLIIKSSMLCPGISQNTKHHHLTLYKGQVWREKPYLELCDHNVLNIEYDETTANFANISSDRWPMEQNGQLSVPPVPGYGFREGLTQIAWDSEILQSFTELTNITNITLHSYDKYDMINMKTGLKDFTHRVEVGKYKCRVDHHKQCVPPHNYVPWYIWTKEGFKI